MKIISEIAIILVVTLLSMSLCSGQGKGKRTPSGYEYRHVVQGKGKSAAAEDYVGFTIKIVGDDGKVLQEMGEGPNMPFIQLESELKIGDEANPVMETLFGVVVGDSIILTMPIDSIPNFPEDLANLKFIKYEMAIKKILNKDEYNAYQDVLKKEEEAKLAANMARIPAIEALIKTTLEDYTSGRLKSSQTTSGLKFVVIEEGIGTNAASGQSVSVDYYGCLTNGNMFDNSFSRGQAITFPLGQGQVIPGWDEGIALLNKGAKAFLFIPANLAYGESGQSDLIPPNSELVFYVELVDIK